MSRIDKLLERGTRVAPRSEEAPIVADDCSCCRCAAASGNDWRIRTAALPQQFADARSEADKLC